MKRVVLLLVLISLTCSTSRAQRADYLSADTRANATKLADAILKDQHALDYVRQLADGIGARLTGSQPYANAVKWAAGTFRKLGLENVHTEKFAMNAAWEPQTPPEAEMLTPRRQALHLVSVGWSPSTPRGGIAGEVVVLGNVLSRESLERERDRIRGKIAIVNPGSLQFPGKFSPGRYFAALSSLKQYGVSAVLIGGGLSENDVEYGGAITMDGSIAALPIARVGREDLALLTRLSDAGPVKIQFRYQNQIRQPAEAENVVAEIRGREHPDEFIVVGAHLDSVQFGNGAQDDGAGVAQVIETARAMKAAGLAPRRTVRFILFGGEEEWELGSRAYVASHQNELAKCAAAIVTDTGADTTYGWTVNGREDETAALSQLRPVLESLGGEGVSRAADFVLQSDHTDFMLRGVPALMLWTDMKRYFQYVHQPGDTFDKVDREKLAKGAAIVAATAYAVADSPGELAPHLSGAEVEQWLKSIGEFDLVRDLQKYGSKVK